MFLLIVLVLLVIWAVSRYVRKTGESRRFTGGTTELAAQLANRGWTLYTRKGCQFCEKQMRELGGSYPRTVDLDQNPDPSLNIEGVPTWINRVTGERSMGFQSLEKLEEMVAGLYKIYPDAPGTLPTPVYGPY